MLELKKDHVRDVSKGIFMWHKKYFNIKISKRDYYIIYNTWIHEHLHKYIYIKLVKGIEVNLEYYFNIVDDVINFGGKCIVVYPYKYNLKQYLPYFTYVQFVNMLFDCLDRLFEFNFTIVLRYIKQFLKELKTNIKLFFKE